MEQPTVQQPLEHTEALQAQIAALIEELALKQEKLEAVRHLLSHDLRAPLRSIDGFSRILLEDHGSLLGDEGHAHLQRVHKAVVVMVKLLDDSLTFLRPIRPTDPPSTVDLTWEAHQIIAGFREAEPERQVKVIIADNLTVQSDRQLCYDLLCYLLDNAWKFTSKTADAEIKFDSLTSDGQMVYFVQDNGAGFAIQHLDKIFQPFQRLHSTSQFPGNGIGLALAQRVVRSLNGRLWAEAAVGQGATFYFTLGSTR